MNKEEQRQLALELSSCTVYSFDEWLDSIVIATEYDFSRIQILRLSITGCMAPSQVAGVVKFFKSYSY